MTFTRLGCPATCEVAFCGRSQKPIPPPHQIWVRTGYPWTPTGTPDSGELPRGSGVAHGVLASQDQRPETRDGAGPRRPAGRWAPGEETGGMRVAWAENLSSGLYSVELA